MTEQEIQNLHQSLIDTAAMIQTKAQLASEKKILRDGKKDAKELRRAQISAEIAADKILYPNAEMRQAATVEQIWSDAGYQTAHAEEMQALTELAAAETETEFHRKTYRAKELLMLYYANNPPAT